MFEFLLVAIFLPLQKNIFFGGGGETIILFYVSLKNGNIRLFSYACRILYVSICWSINKFCKKKILPAFSTNFPLRQAYLQCSSTDTTPPPPPPFVLYDYLLLNHDLDFTIRYSIFKRCSFKGDIGKLNTRMNIGVCLLPAHIYSLDMCRVRQYSTKN